MKNRNMYKFGVRVEKAGTLAALLLLSLVSAATAVGFVSIAPDEANELITSSEDLVILDIRPVEAYNSERIKDAVCETDLGAIQQYIGKEILVYDNNGTESAEFCAMLAQLSHHGLRFKKIYNLKGGLKAWKEAGFQTVGRRTLTPPLPAVTTTSPAAETSTAIATPGTSEPASATPISAVTAALQTTTTLAPTTATTAEPSSQTPGFEAMSMVIGILISIAIGIKAKNRGRR